LGNYDVVTFSAACSIRDKSFVEVRISNDKSAYGDLCAGEGCRRMSGCGRGFIAASPRTLFLEKWVGGLRLG
jgi:hypothetical protein